MASGQDVRYSAERVKQGEDLTNKLWNASRLVLTNAGDAEPGPRDARLEDRWIVSAMERHTARVNELIDSFRFSPAALELYDAFWGDVCDWYLELVKPRLYEGDQDAAAVLLHVLGRSLVLLHPVMPHVTEEIWSFMPGDRELLAVSPWPAADESLLDPDAEQAMEHVREAVTAIRRLRDDAGVKPGVLIPAQVNLPEDAARHIANLARLDVSTDGDDPVATIAGVRILASGEFDAEALTRRLAERRKQLTDEIGRAEKKLGNPGFTDKAPLEVVEAERDKLERFRHELENLGE
jgi:valyl-tRNA synthetase